MTENNGREAAKDNDLFFTCSLIDYIARKTQNTRADVVNMLGAEKVEKIYDLADIYHSDDIGFSGRESHPRSRVLETVNLIM